eukprot:CAMPEP_0114582930 /NCGR_PEP_ID=MMETSP0125-20121206/6785_1 /TAXON_ID=485358 ORGANISM="Aristerostoma sp., Strain ATCC 50986" /NCGR_SAMPLE_ID=MMETSP0125 /ASSEMBLY_ACC=CAM_ASM_000245 /LENGTH=51 /DNA_ID=CAMNT_0001776123 /DNA_START=193 /DNA_END=348 /DNA_ORIENTATION=-
MKEVLKEYEEPLRQSFLMTKTKEYDYHEEHVDAPSDTIRNKFRREAADAYH